MIGIIAVSGEAPRRRIASQPASTGKLKSFADQASLLTMTTLVALEFNAVLIATLLRADEPTLCVFEAIIRLENDN